MKFSLFELILKISPKMILKIKQFVCVFVSKQSKEHRCARDYGVPHIKKKKEEEAKLWILFYFIKRQM